MISNKTLAVFDSQSVVLKIEIKRFNCQTPEDNYIYTYIICIILRTGDLCFIVVKKTMYKIR